MLVLLLPTLLMGGRCSITTPSQCPPMRRLGKSNDSTISIAHSFTLLHRYLQQTHTLPWLPCFVDKYKHTFTLGTSTIPQTHFCFVNTTYTHLPYLADTAYTHIYPASSISISTIFTCQLSCAVSRAAAPAHRCTGSRASPQKRKENSRSQS